MRRKNFSLIRVLPQFTAALALIALVVMAAPKTVFGQPQAQAMPLSAGEKAVFGEELLPSDEVGANKIRDEEVPLSTNEKGSLIHDEVVPLRSTLNRQRLIIDEVVPLLCLPKGQCRINEQPVPLCAPNGKKGQIIDGNVPLCVRVVSKLINDEPVPL